MATDSLSRGARNVVTLTTRGFRTPFSDSIGTLGGTQTLVVTGTITTTSGSTTVTGQGTSFLTELRPGDIIYQADGTTLIGVVASIESDTSLTLVATAAAVQTALAYVVKVYTNGAVAYSMYWGMGLQASLA